MPFVEKNLSSSFVHYEINLKKAGRIRFFKFIRMRDSFYSPSTVSYSLGSADFA